MAEYNDRDLLLLIKDRLDKIDERLRDGDKDIIELKLKVRELETKLKLWSAIASIGSSVITSLIIYFLQSKM